MKIIVNAVLLFLAFSQSASALEVKQLSLNSLDSNQSLTINSADHKLIYLDFWASWCKPCAKSFPFMNSLEQQYKDAGLTVIAVNMDENVTDAERFLRKIPAEFSVYTDPEAKLAKKLKVTGLPVSYLISNKGEVLARYNGFNSRKAAKLEQHIKQLLEQE